MEYAVAYRTHDVKTDDLHHAVWHGMLVCIANHIIVMWSS